MMKSEQTAGEYDRGRLCLVSLMAMLLCGAVIGCAGGSPGEESEGHEFPAHRPTSYEQLVAELERRCGEAAAEAGSTAEVSELQDLIGWIVEFAADSELRKADFEKAASLGRRLQQLSQAGGLAGEQRGQVLEVLRDLRELVPRSRDLNAQQATEVNSASGQGGR